MFKKLLNKAIFRLLARKSPKREIVAGTPLAAIVSGGLAMWVDPATAAAIAGPLGTLCGVLVNLASGEGPGE